MTHGDLVSVVVPAYSHHRFVEASLRSLIRQTYDPLEIVVIDDGSSDGTFEVIETLVPELRRRFIRIHVSRKAHEGAPQTITQCLELVSSDFVFMLDSDDAAYPHAIELLKPLLDAPDVALAVGDNRYVDDEDRPYAPLRAGTARDTLLAFHTADRAEFSIARDFGTYASLIRGNYVPNGWLFRRSAVRAVGGYTCGLLLDDWPLLLRLAKQFRIVFADAVLADYRIHSGNISRIQRDQIILDELRVLLAEFDYCRERAFENEWWAHMRQVVCTLTREQIERSDLIAQIIREQPQAPEPPLRRLVASVVRAAEEAATPVHRPRPVRGPLLPPPPGSGGERIHLYALCWNDARLLPYFFRHYDPLVQHYVIFDDGSTDGSLQMLEAHPRVEVRRFERTHPESFVLSELAFYNECWKESRGAADWVFVVDVDEHLHHPDLAGYLARCRANGITAVPALGFEMVSDAFPDADVRLSASHTRGVPAPDMSKLAIFAPDSVRELRHAVGGHSSTPVGALLPPRDEVLLLHYKALGSEYLVARHGALGARLSSSDRAQGWGVQWAASPPELHAQFEKYRAEAVDTSIPGALGAFPGSPWWVRVLPRVLDAGYVQEHASTVERLTETTAALSSARHEIGQLHAALALSRARVNEIEQSRSWRWTSPVRYAFGAATRKQTRRAMPSTVAQARDLRWPSPFELVRDLIQYGRIGWYVWHSRRIIGWTRGLEAPAVASASYKLQGSPVIVEIGCFLGCATVLLAGARKLRSAGRVHCIDPFDASGDAFSVPVYQSIAATLDRPLRQVFETHLRRAGLNDWVTIHEGKGTDVVRDWHDPIDLLYLDGDVSRNGVRETYSAWHTWLRPGGVLVVSSTGTTEPGHDGPMHLVAEFVRPPAYSNIRQVEGITFAIKCEVDGSPDGPGDALSSRTASERQQRPANASRSASSPRAAG
jgi:glycosyltransferase involved in cell wall biosynthesis